MLDRSRAIRAARAFTKDIQSNSLATNYLYRVVNHVLDDIEEQLATPRPRTMWMVYIPDLPDITPAVWGTRARARGHKRRLAKQGVHDVRIRQVSADPEDV